MIYYLCLLRWQLLLLYLLPIPCPWPVGWLDWTVVGWFPFIWHCVFDSDCGSFCPTRGEGPFYPLTHFTFIWTAPFLHLVGVWFGQLQFGHILHLLIWWFGRRRSYGKEGRTVVFGAEEGKIIIGIVACRMALFREKASGIFGAGAGEVGWVLAAAFTRWRSAGALKNKNEKWLAAPRSASAPL